MKHRANRPTDSYSLADRDGLRALPMSDWSDDHLTDMYAATITSERVRAMHPCGVQYAALNDLIARMEAEIDRRWMAGVRAEIAAMEGV